MKRGLFNWKIAGNPNAVYEELINWDVGKIPWNKRHKTNWFFLHKRKSYRPTIFLEEYPEYIITDSYNINTSWCVDWDCITYYYAVSPDRDRYIVFKRECWSCDIRYIEIGDRCSCGETRFFEVFAPSDKFSGLVTGVSVYNENTYWWIEADDEDKVDIGDFVTITDIQAGSLIPCWQSRQVIFKTKENWKTILQLTTPRTNIPEWKTSWAIVTVSNDVGLVPAYLWKRGITTLIDGNVWNSLCDYSDNACPVSVTQHNGTLTYLNNKGYNFYWWIGFDSSSISANNTNVVWEDKIESVSFKNFLVFFWKRSISTVVFDETGQNSFKYELRDDIGIHNRWAYALFSNWLYFVGSDNRIYAANISGAWTNFNLELEDITENILPHMENVKEDDEVYMSSDGKDLYVFINSKDFNEANNYANTKICKFNSIYGIWMVHTICWEVISRYKNNEFLGSNIFNYCWYDWDGVNNKPYNAIAEAVVHWHEELWMEDQDWWPLDLFRNHKLDECVILLWLWQYSSNTHIEVHKYDNYKYSRVYEIDDDNYMLSDWKRAMQWEVIEPNDCFKDKLTACDNILNPCEWNTRSYENTNNECGWCETQVEYDDYCVCYNDNKYALSPIHKMKLKFDTDYWQFFKVRFVIGHDRVMWNDIGSFGWMYITTNTDIDFTNNADNFTDWCCSSAKQCPNSWC